MTFHRKQTLYFHWCLLYQHFLFCCWKTHTMDICYTSRINMQIIYFWQNQFAYVQHKVVVMVVTLFLEKNWISQDWFSRQPGWKREGGKKSHLGFAVSVEIRTFPVVVNTISFYAWERIAHITAVCVHVFKRKHFPSENKLCVNLFWLY